MLMCEAAIFTCSVLSLRWQMADHSQEGGQDMAMYTVLCAVSTFCASATTILLLVIPTQVCTRSELCVLLIIAQKALLAWLDTERQYGGAGVDLTGREWRSRHTERFSSTVSHSTQAIWRCPADKHPHCRPAGTESPGWGRWRACIGPTIRTSTSCRRRL